MAFSSYHHYTTDGCDDFTKIVYSRTSNRKRIRASTGKTYTDDISLQQINTLHQRYEL